MTTQHDETPEVNAIVCRFPPGLPLDSNDAIAQYNDLVDCARELERDRNRLRAQFAAARGGIDTKISELQSALREQIAGNEQLNAQLAGVVELAAKIAADAAPGFCGGKGEIVLYTVADEIRSLSPTEAKGEQPGAGEDAWKIDGYEYLRKLTPNDFKRLWERNLAGENFDDMVRDAARGAGKECK